jgi:hypothetical protein
LKYLEKVPADESLWQGECFVFDERVSVSHGLPRVSRRRACQHPLTGRDRCRRNTPPASHAHIADARSDEDRALYRAPAPGQLARRGAGARISAAQRWGVPPPTLCSSPRDGVAVDHPQPCPVGLPSGDLGGHGAVGRRVESTPDRR